MGGIFSQRPAQAPQGGMFAPQRTLDQSANYNTPISPQEEAAFQVWRAHLPPNLQNMEDYDLRGAWKKNAQAAGNGHLPDDWKKPNHPTFSNESIYSGPTTEGGSWVQGADGKWLYVATPDNLRYRDAGALKDYFKRVEPDSRLILPADLSNLKR